MIKDIFKTITVIVAIFALIGLCLTEYGFAYFIGACLIGFLASYLAGRKNKDQRWAFVYGWTWGLIVAIYYLVCAKEEAKEIKEIKPKIK